MIIRKLNKDHYLCKRQPYKNPSKLLSIGAKRFWNNYSLDCCDGAYGAFDNGKLIGFVRFESYDQTYYACGTYVEPNYRRKGIGKILWNKLVKLAIKEKKVIEVCTATRKGAALLKSVKRETSGIRHFEA